MAFDVSYDEKSDCVCITVTGEFNFSYLKKMAPIVGKLLSEHNCNRVLNILVDAVLINSASETYYMPELARKSGVPRRVKRALVVKEITPELLFLETVFLNSGNIVKMFVDVDEAKQWLFTGNTTSKKINSSQASAFPDTMHRQG